MTKKIIIVVMGLLLVLTGCGAQNSAASASPSLSAPTVSASPALSSAPASVAPEASGSASPEVSASASESPSPYPSVELTDEETKLTGGVISIPARDFSLPKTDGTLVSLSGLKGKPVVINFWATWCPYCVAEFKDLSQAMKNYPDIQFIAIDTSESGKDLTQQKTRGAIEKDARKQGLDLPIVFDTDGTVWTKDYPTQGLPTTIFIDSAGNMRMGRIGMMQNYEMLDTYLKILIRADTKA